MANELSDIKAAAQIAMRNGALAPQNFEGLWRMAQIMAASGFMPKGMERVESVFVAVQFGMEVGLSPMQAVQNIAPINGRPAIWGDAMLGLVRASGYMESIKEDVIGSGDAMEAVCQVWRKGEDNPVTHRFSVADAKRAGLWGKGQDHMAAIPSPHAADACARILPSRYVSRRPQRSLFARGTRRRRGALYGLCGC